MIKPRPRFGVVNPILACRFGVKVVPRVRAETAAIFVAEIQV